MDSEQFSNPLAPASTVARKQPEEDKSQPLTNSDFRKLMMTPRVLNHSSGSAPVPGSVRGSIRSKHFKQPLPKNEVSDDHKKKKKYHDSHRKPEDDVMSELNKRYRDRAKERRENRELGDQVSATAYHAVGPASLEMDAETRRKQMIEESKYLGGDLEHTHLVKGLDYVLLEKVKDEIQNKDDEEEYRRQFEEEMAKKEEEEKKKSQTGLSNLADISFDVQDRYSVKSKFAEKILKIVHKKADNDKNELLAQGRMSYHYDLADFSESDIPTTIILSKADMMNNETYNTISTNKIVIDKLIQIWSNLRMEGSSKKTPKAKLDTNLQTETSVKPSNAKVSPDEDNIFDDVDDYVPVITKRSNKNRIQTSRWDKVPREPSTSKTSYFESDKSKELDSINSSKRSDEQKALEMAASVIGSMAAKSDNINLIRRRARIQNEPDSYAECYPGAPENDDAIVDSDDEADNTKLDSTKKKTPAKRWDNITDDYPDHIGSREIEPKSNDNKSNKKEKKVQNAKLDRDLQKINSIIAKRKEARQESGLEFMVERKPKRIKN